MNLPMGHSDPEGHRFLSGPWPQDDFQLFKFHCNRCGAPYAPSAAPQWAPVDLPVDIRRGDQLQWSATVKADGTVVDEHLEIWTTRQRVVIPLDDGGLWTPDRWVEEGMNPDGYDWWPTVVEPLLLALRASE